MILSDRVSGAVSGRGLLLVVVMATTLAALPGFSPAQTPKPAAPADPTAPAPPGVAKSDIPPLPVLKTPTPASMPPGVVKSDPLAPPVTSPAIRLPVTENIRMDLSALDLGERYLKADADLKIAAQKLKNVMALAKDKVVSNQEVQLYEIEMTRAERTFKLMQSFLNAELGNAEQALESQTKQFQLVSEGYKKGIIPQAELLQVRAKMEECEARLRLIKVVADLAGK